MANPFDAFDNVDMDERKRNPFDQFDAPKPAPVDVPAEKPGPSASTMVGDVIGQAVRGFNRGINAVVSVPGEIAGFVADKYGADGDRFRWNNAVSRTMQSADVQPETAAGRYADAAGRSVGMSVAPTGAILANATRLAAIAPTTAVRSIGQTIGQQFATRPGVAVAADLAGAATGAAAQQGAADAGASAPIQLLAGMAGGMVPGIALAYRYPSTTRIGTETGETMAAQRAREATADSDAFQRLGVREFGPAHHSGPMASVAKQISETPIIGGPLRQNLDETFADGAGAARRIAENISPNTTADSAGRTMQQGLERFASARLQDLDPGIVQGMGINPVNPIPANQAMGAGQAQRLAQANAIRAQAGQQTNQTAGGTVVPMAQSRNAYLTRRTTTEDLTDQQLTTVIQAPAASTSFATKSEALYERAWRFIPERLRANGTARPNMAPAYNTRQVLTQIDDDIRNSFQGQRTVNAELAERIRSAQAGNFPIGDLFAIRTQVGRDLGRFGPLDTGLDRQQLNALYGALSNDIENGLIDIANSALIATRAQGPGRVTMEDANRAANALRAFRTASRHHRAGMQRIESMMAVINAASPEQAVKKLVTASYAGTRGNEAMIRRAMQALRPPERAEFGALIVREMGTPTPGARGVVAEVDWSPSKFLTGYRAMSPGNRDAIFSAEHQTAIDDLVRVATRLSHVEAQANTSRSATNALNITATVGAMSSAVGGDIITPMIIGGSGYATAIMMSRPEYARWMVNYLQLRAAVRAGTDRAIAPLVRHVGGLERQIEMNPALAPVLLAVQRDLGVSNTPEGAESGR